MSLTFAKYRPLPESEAVSVDFSKGLDYSVKGMDVGAKHSPDALNVDWGTDGGWRSRKVTSPFNTDALPADVKWMGTYEREDGTVFVVMSFADGSIRATSGGKGSASYQIKAAGGGVWRGVEVNFLYYFMDGANPCLKWDGTTLTTMGQAWSPTYGTITAGNMPIARYGAVFHNRMILCDLLEVGIRHRNRVRISHPLNNLRGQEDYREADSFEADIGADGDSITGIKVCGSRCFIFKGGATYEFTGWDTDADNNDLIRLEPLSRDVGSVSQESISSVGQECYFWDGDHGPHRVTEVPNSGGRFIFVEPIMVPLQPLLIADTIPSARAAEVTSGSVDRLVYYSVPWTGGKRTFAYNVDMNNWTQYDLQLGPFAEYDRSDSRGYALGYNLDVTAAKRVLALGLDGDLDDFGNRQDAITSYVRTPWLHADSPFIRKVWLQMNAVIEGVGITLPFAVSADYDLDAILGSGSLGLGTSIGDFPLNNVTLEPVLYEVLYPGAPQTPIRTTGPGSYIHAMLTPTDQTGVASARMRECDARAVSVLLRGPSVSKSYSVRGISLRFRASARI